MSAKTVGMCKRLNKSIAVYMGTYGWFVQLTDRQQQAAHNGTNCGRSATHKRHTHIKTPETQLMI